MGKRGALVPAIALAAIGFVLLAFGVSAKTTGAEGVGAGVPQRRPPRHQRPQLPRRRRRPQPAPHRRPRGPDRHVALVAYVQATPDNVEKGLALLAGGVSLGRRER